MCYAVVVIFPVLSNGLEPIQSKRSLE